MKWSTNLLVEILKSVIVSRRISESQYITIQYKIQSLKKVKHFNLLPQYYLINKVTWFITYKKTVARHRQYCLVVHDQILVINVFSRVYYDSTILRLCGINFNTLQKTYMLIVHNISNKKNLSNKSATLTWPSLSSRVLMFTYHILRINCKIIECYALILQFLNLNYLKLGTQCNI